MSCVDFSSLKEKRVFVTGGGGWLGHHAVTMLAKAGAFVTVYDFSVPDEKDRAAKELEEDTLYKPNFYRDIANNDHIKIIKGDITDFDFLERSARGSDLYMNMASIGLDFQPSYEMMYKVNVEGANNAIKICQKNKIRFLVHTSSFAVVFSGEETHLNGDETVPYPEKYADNYCKTKSLAEQLVLSKNNTTPSDLLLVTCLRPGGIYGPQAYNTVGPMLSFAKKGLLWVKVGKAKLGLVHVKDMARAHVMAAAQLLAYTPGSDMPIPPCAGQAFFVDDDSPRNMFEYFIPMLKKLNYSYPVATLPSFVWITLAYLMAFLCWVLRLLRINVKPIINMNMITHSTVNHYYSPHKIEQVLGWKPEYTPEQGLADTTAYYLDLQKKEKEKKKK